jgi:hypothetical protein
MTSVASDDATSSAISGSRRPLVSLTTEAPAARHRRATSGRKVSTETTTSDAAVTAATTGTTRSISSASLTSGVSGENGTPPMSTQPAPASAARRAAATAESKR